MKRPTHTAMVMAAGHGTRMRPLTDDRSKAMVEVAGRPLIGHMLDRLDEAGIRRAVVNVHAHADHLEDHLSQRTSGPEIIISDERDLLLETGGGLVKALPLLGEEPILICNIDSVWTEFAPVLPALLDSWDPETMDEMLLLAPTADCLGYHGKGDFDLARNGTITRRVGTSADYVFAGVQMFKPDLAKGYPKAPFSRARIWDVTLPRGRVYGLPIPGRWMHVGDPVARDAAEARLAEAAS